jgi:hypothetical protein
MIADLIDKKRLKFLKNITRDVVEACRVQPNNIQGDNLVNKTGRPLIVPAGCAGYPAFWIEDMTLSLASGLISPDELWGMFELTLETQNGPETKQLDSGAEIPPFAIANHILFTGEPVFFPGTYSPGPDQGGEPFGKLPDLDDNFYAIEMGHWYNQKTSKTDFLKSKINGLSIIERLEKAFYAVPYNPTTNLVQVSKEKRGTNWGFVDTVQMTGELLFCSILRLRGARRLAVLFEAISDKQKADVFLSIVKKIKISIQSVFATESGWLLAATKQCRQHDVWGTAYAIYEDILEGQAKQKALEAILKSYKNGTSTCRGNVRHILTTEDYSQTSAWETTITKLNNYQNGAYWGTPSGWFLYALSQISAKDCRSFIAEFVNELIENDYRKKGTVGSPLECFHPKTDHWQNPVYMASVTCPLVALYRLGYS